MEGYYFDHALLISCIDGLGRFSGKSEVYEKEIDTVSTSLQPTPLSNVGSTGDQSGRLQTV